MGITRRKIDIGKKITFYFLQIFWKCTVFFAFAFKVCKKCYYDPKNFFLKNIIMGIKKTQNFVLISNSLMPTETNALKKARAKNYANFEYFRFCAFFRGFLLLTFVRSISQSRHQRIWNQHKSLRFFDTHNDIFQ